MTVGGSDAGGWGLIRRALVRRGGRWGGRICAVTIGEPINRIRNWRRRAMASADAAGGAFNRRAGEGRGGLVAVLVRMLDFIEKRHPDAFKCKARQKASIFFLGGRRAN